MLALLWPRWARQASAKSTVEGKEKEMWVLGIATLVAESQMISDAEWVKKRKKDRVLQLRGKRGGTSTTWVWIVASLLNKKKLGIAVLVSTSQTGEVPIWAKITSVNHPEMPLLLPAARSGESHQWAWGATALFCRSVVPVSPTLELLALPLPREQLWAGSLRAAARPGLGRWQRSAWRDQVGPPVSAQQWNLVWNGHTCWGASAALPLRLGSPGGWLNGN